MLVERAYFVFRREGEREEERKEVVVEKGMKRSEASCAVARSLLNITGTAEERFARSDQRLCHTSRRHQ